MLTKNILVAIALVVLVVNVFSGHNVGDLLPNANADLNRSLRSEPTRAAPSPRSPQQKEKLLVVDQDDIYQYRGIWDSSPIVIEQYKLVFFTIPKVGCTTFKQLFRRMMGHRNWRSQDGRLMLPHNPFKNGLKYLYNFPLEQANEILTSPLYTRAIFVRDPKLRFLSAFLDKALSNNGLYIREKCCPATGDCVEQAQTLEGFLQLAESCQDTHWMPQSERLDQKYWKYIDFVGHLETAEEDTRCLLERIGAWEEFGRFGWGKNGNSSIFENPADAGGHATHSRWEVWKWYNQAAERQVESFYKQDYDNALFNFTRTRLVQH